MYFFASPKYFFRILEVRRGADHTHAKLHPKLRQRLEGEEAEVSSAHCRETLLSGTYMVPHLCVLRAFPGTLPFRPDILGRTPGI